jgi:hypothetical protein
MCLAASLAAKDAFVLAEEGVSIGIDVSDGKATIVVQGVSEAVLARIRATEQSQAVLSRLLKVYAGEEAIDDRPPVLGSVQLQKDQLVFTPRYSLRPGLAYRVVLARQLVEGEAPIDKVPDALEQVVRIAEDMPREATVITAVFPSGDVLPENLLKFYVHFSAPMAQGDVYRHVRLLDDGGKEVDYPFVNVGQELWDRSGTRITLLLDPGRIKRGLRPREELGPILHEGREYELVVDGDWKDAHSRLLGEDFRKRFRVAAPDDVQPDVAKWKVDPPPAGTTSPLAVRFEEPLDHAMLSSSFEVFDEHRRAVAGRIQVGEGETLWQFVPDRAWTAGDYAIVVESALEDRAGNSIEKPFEVDVFEKVEAKVTRNEISIPFRVSQKPQD